METQLKPDIVIEPPVGWRFLGLKELWYYRELFFFLAWRDVKVRYKQTILGVAWVVLQPLCTMAIFTFLFGKLAAIPTSGVPYPLFALSGLVPWIFFSAGVTNAAQSVVSDANLIKKVYFPRLIVPTASVSAAFIDLTLMFLLLLLLTGFYGIAPSWKWCLLPLFFVNSYLTTLGVSYWLAGFNALFRDVKHIIPFVIQVGMFLSPIAYPASLVPEAWQMLYALNPVVGVVEGLRAILFGSEVSFPALVLSLVVGGLTFLSGMVYFKKIETNFADIV